VLEEKLKFKSDRMSKTCKWFEVCPLKRYYEEGKLKKKWIEDYCKGDYKNCVRYKMVEKGIPNPDNMLPNGEIRDDLK